MGLGDADLLDDGDVGGGGKGAAAVSCSICFDAVVDNGERSWAKLLCGHQFHLGELWILLFVRRCLRSTRFYVSDSVEFIEFFSGVF